MITVRETNLTTVKFFWTKANGPVSTKQLAEAAKGLADKVTGMTFSVAEGGFPQMDAGPMVRVTTPVDITRRIRDRAAGWIWSLSKLPLITLAVSAIGVLNAIMASVRASTWDMGVLRSLGFGRSALVRMVIAEALLVGLVACLLSVGFGITAGWCGSGISQYVSFFGGLNPSLVIPWGKVGMGVGTTLLLCLLAALWPAIQTGRLDTLRLLQAGRSAF